MISRPFQFLTKVSPILVFLLCAICSGVQAQPAFYTLMTNGPASNRINIVFLSEGYTTNSIDGTNTEMDKFLVDAKEALNKLLSFEPYNEYRGFCNAYAIAVPSEDSGATHLQWPLRRNTYFNSTYDADEDRILTIPPHEDDTNYDNGLGKVDALLQAEMPQRGALPTNCLPIILVNDLVAGGSGGRVCVAALGEPSAEFLAHESGHTLAKLDDEYNASRDYASTSDPDTQPNTTRETRRGYIKWNLWIDDSTPLPTPDTNTYANVVGLFEGAHYTTTGWYRPQLNCIMRQMEGTPFCSVCSEALVKAIYQRVQTIDSYTPSISNLPVTDGDSVQFRVNTPQPLTHALSVQWFLNDIAISGATNPVYNLASSSLANGSHTLRAQVRDITPAVRNDPLNLLSNSVAWTVVGSGLSAAPSIVSQPQSQAHRAGEKVTFSVIAAGSLPLTYQWMHNGTNFGPATTAMTNSSLLVITNAQADRVGDYAVVVSNELGEAVSDTATLNLSFPLSIILNGPGSVTPNYNGQWLVTGRSYSVTAVPASGCVFSNWTGVFSTNKPRLTFAFAPDLVLTANFIDKVKPTISIAGPTEGARPTNSPITISGRATDNAGVAVVQYRLNGGGFLDAASTNNWKTWSAVVSPRAGSNIVEVVSIDSSGVRSATAPRKFTYVVKQALTALTNGNGTLSPNLNGKLLEIGQKYSIKAIPGKGQVFAGWTDGSRNATFGFQMQSNLVVEAKFVTNPFVAIKGAYTGIFQQDGNTSRQALGLVKLTLTDQGRFSGTLINDASYTFSGSFWVDGISQVVIPRKGKTPLSLTLSLDLVNGTEQIQGSVTDGTWTAPLTCDRAVFSSTHSALQSGRYTVALASSSGAANAPLGDGIATATIDSLGTLRASGTLADGTTFSQTSMVSKDGRWPLFATLNSGKGLVVGWLTVTNRDTSSIEGNALWIKVPVSGRYYTNGFTNTVSVLGSSLQPYVKGTRLIPAPQANVVLQGGGLSSLLTNTVAISTNNVVSVLAGTNKLTLTLSTSTGTASGSFVDPSTRATRTLKGVVLQQQSVIRGFFLGTNTSGAFIVQP